LRIPPCRQRRPCQRAVTAMAQRVSIPCDGGLPAGAGGPRHPYTARRHLVGIEFRLLSPLDRSAPVVPCVKPSVLRAPHGRLGQPPAWQHSRMALSRWVTLTARIATAWAAARELSAARRSPSPRDRLCCYHWPPRRVRRGACTSSTTAAENRTRGARAPFEVRHRRACCDHPSCACRRGRERADGRDTQTFRSHENRAIDERVRWPARPWQAAESALDERAPRNEAL
jgi:hypothetical protein